MLQRDVDLFQQAVKLALQSNHFTRVGCIAARNQRILAGAFNTIRNPPKNVSYGEATRHAEHNCLALLNENVLPRVTLYIARINQSGFPMPSAPCKWCRVEIAALDIKELVYISGQRRLVKEIR